MTKYYGFIELLDSTGLIYILFAHNWNHPENNFMQTGFESTLKCTAAENLTKRTHQVVIKELHLVKNNLVIKELHLTAL